MVFKITKKNIIGGLWLDTDVHDKPDLYMVGLDVNGLGYRLVSLCDGDIFVELTFISMKRLLESYTYMGNLADLDIESFIAEKHA